MEIKDKKVLLEKGKEKDYWFICDADSPLGELHDVFCRMKADIVSRIFEAQKAEAEVKEKTE